MLLLVPRVTPAVRHRAAAKVLRRLDQRLDGGGRAARAHAPARPRSRGCAPARPGCRRWRDGAVRSAGPARARSRGGPGSRATRRACSARPRPVVDVGVVRAGGALQAAPAHEPRRRHVGRALAGGVRGNGGAHPGEVAREDVEQHGQVPARAQSREARREQRPSGARVAIDDAPVTVPGARRAQRDDRGQQRDQHRRARPVEERARARRMRTGRGSAAASGSPTEGDPSMSRLTRSPPGAAPCGPAGRDRPGGLPTARSGGTPRRARTAGSAPRRA